MKGCIFVAILLTIITCAIPAFSDSEQTPVNPAAVFHFQERGTGVKGYGAKTSDILFATLVSNPDICLVDRLEIVKILEEYELNLSGMVQPGQAIQVCRLTGAKILVTGSIVEADKSLYLVAKIIGSETGKVLGASVKAKTSDELAPLVESLAVKIANVILTQSDKLVAKPLKTKDRIAHLREKLGNAPRPVLAIKVSERHVGKPGLDPAAETEIMFLCQKTGFDVISAESGKTGKADILIQGEGFSEFAMRKKNVVLVKARLEVKAIDRTTRKIIAIDRQTVIEADIAEQVAAKNALEKAASEIMDRLLPKLVRTSQ